MDFKRCCELIPSGCSTYSKQPNRYVEGVYPIFGEPRPGAYLWADGQQYIDYTMGLGAVVLGNANPRVNEAVLRQVHLGNTIGAPSAMEGELAEKLCDLIPSAQMVRFTNTGTEACMAAIKIARAYTGRERVMCCGYHGWGSWYSAQTEQNHGCTEAEKAQIQSFTYNDMADFTRVLESSSLPAAVIMEPYVLDAPKDGFLHHIHAACAKRGIILIFDEVVTGFRTTDWTAQKMFGVTPDLTCVGKCMANGLVPISAVCGHRNLMEVISNDCFISGTFAANPLALAASLATIKAIEDFGAIHHIWEMGTQLKSYFEQIVASKSLQGVTVKGYPCRTWFDFPTEAHKSLFWQECFRQGVWFGYAQFLSLGHSQMEMDQTVRAMKMGIDKVATHWDHPEKALEGKPAQATFRMAVHDTPKVEPARKYRCEDCKTGFDVPYVAEYGRYRGKEACPTCHKTEIVETVI
jgi:glutamate-1-semialdehyde 2,1-aminomutase/spore coat polysaccharide biosynthesis protein SpsF